MSVWRNCAVWTVRAGRCLDGAGAAVRRFHRRGAGSAPDPWHAQVRAIVEREGADAHLADYHARLVTHLARRPHAAAIPSIEGDEDATYRAIVASLARD
ncbi:hypothetical protein JCM10369A_35090 [Nocardioides pyridinolyticus]